MPFQCFDDGLSLHYLDFPYIPSPTQSGRRAKPPSQTVVLLHGLGANSYSWILQINSLVRAGYRVIAPDLRGYGISFTAENRYSIPLFTRDLNRLLGHLRLDLIHLVGISLGGAVSLQYSLDFPEMVQKLILVNTAARFRPETFALAIYYARRLASSVLMGVDRQAWIVANHILPYPHQERFRRSLVEQIEAADPRAYRKTIRSLIRFDVRGRLGEIHSPALVVTGEEDRTVAPRTQALLVTRIPTARQVFFPGAGHALIAEEPVRFNRVLIEFLTSLE